MSKANPRPSQKEIKAQRKAHKEAQRALRQRQKAEGFIVPPSPTKSNGTSPYKTVEEERAARLDSTSQQLKVIRAMLPVLLVRLSKITDPRNPQKSKHKLTVLMIYGVLCFVFQMSSRRDANERMTLPLFQENLRRLFPELAQLPHNDTLARLLARIDVAEIEKAHQDMIERLMHNKKFRRFLIQGCYPIAIDGTRKLVRDELWDEECLERKVRSKPEEDKAPEPGAEAPPAKEYYVYVLEAVLAFQNGMVIPLMSEILSYNEGDSDREKQDCEQKAFKRLAQRLKERFSHLSIILFLDGLYANGPIIQICRQNHWDYMIVLKDKSLATVQEEIEGLKKLPNNDKRVQKWGDRRQNFSWFNDIQYRYQDPVTGKEQKHKLHVVICEESWEEIAPGSTQEITVTSRHVWISGQPLNRNNVHERCNLGARHRWGIEANILVEKHHGYQYEHCFSYDWKTMRGYHYLMHIGHALNVLVRYSYAMAKYVRDHGVSGLIALVHATLASPWLSAQDLDRIATEPCQIRLE